MNCSPLNLNRNLTLNPFVLGGEIKSKITIKIKRSRGLALHFK